MIAAVGIMKKGKSFIIFLLSQLLVIIFFSMMYWYLVHTENQITHFKGLDHHSSLKDFFYYSLTTQATVGFGDIVPVSSQARTLVMIQMIIIYVGIGITESYIVKHLTTKKFFQPFLMIMGIVVLAFAPPIAAIIANIVKKK